MGGWAKRFLYKSPRGCVHGPERNALCLGLRMQIGLVENANQTVLQFESDRASVIA